MQPVAVTAMTLTCAMGTGLDPVRIALGNRSSGLRRNDFPHCELDTWIGRVAGVEDVVLPARLADRHCRNNQLALMGLERDGFIDKASAAVTRFGAERVACMIGTSTGGIGATEDAYRASDGPLPPAWRLPRVHTPATTAGFVADLLGLSGPVYTISTACSSSAKVFAGAERLMRADLVDAVVVGGVDSLCLSVLYGFHALELISAAPCRPFDTRRDGLNLGEAAGFALLERGTAHAGAYLIGAGESSDAWHMSAPHPEGTGVRRAMQQALDTAELAPGQVDYINLHGTATPLNDASEADVITELFDDQTPASSTKAWTGHTLGAAGMSEAILAMLALEAGELPGTLNCEQPEKPADRFLLTANIKRSIDTVMSNSFGFGGSNCSLIFSRACSHLPYHGPERRV